MTVHRKKLPDFDNLVGTGTATIDIECGMTFHNIILDFTGSTTFNRSHIKEVRVLLNGKAIIRAPATVLHRDNLYKGSFADDNFLLIDFEEPRSRTIEAQIATAIHTYSGVQTFKIELEIVGATAPKIETHANCTATQLPLGFLPCFFRESYDAVSTGVKQIKYGYQRENAHMIKRVHWIPSVDEVEGLPATHITSLSLIKNSVRVIDKLRPAANVFYQKHYEGIPQTNIMTVDFVEDNNTLVHLMTTQDGWVMWELEVKAVAHFDIYYSVIATLDTI